MRVRSRHLKHQSDKRPVHRCLALITVLLGSLTASMAAAEALSIGGDTFVGDKSAELSSGAARDVFVAGFSATLSAAVQGDAHLAGFSAFVQAPVAGDLYAAGSDIEIEAGIGGDLTAAGFSVELADEARVDGNVRLSAGNLIIDAPIAGAMLATAASLRLNAPIGGDARITAADIRFGRDAEVAGTLTYSAPEAIAIPESVVPASRVRFVPTSPSSIIDEVGDTVREPLQNYWPGIVTGMTAAMLMLGFLVLISAILFAFAPQLTESMRQRASEHAWFALVFGFVGLSILFGAVPVSLMTLIGIPFAPVVLLMLLIFWVIGYLLGIYIIGTRLWSTFDARSARLPAKLAVVAIGLVIMAALNFIPIIGWLVNLVILFLGVGAITIVLLDVLLRHTRLSPPSVNADQADSPDDSVSTA